MDDHEHIDLHHAQEEEQRREAMVEEGSAPLTAGHQREAMRTRVEPMIRNMCQEVVLSFCATAREYRKLWAPPASVWRIVPKRDENQKRSAGMRLPLGGGEAMEDVKFVLLGRRIVPWDNRSKEPDAGVWIFGERYLREPAPDQRMPWLARSPFYIPEAKLECLGVDASGRVVVKEGTERVLYEWNRKWTIAQEQQTVNRQNLLEEEVSSQAEVSRDFLTLLDCLDRITRACRCYMVRGNVSLMDLIIHLSEAEGYYVPVYVVGGAVRDALWDNAFNDIDLAVALPYERLCRHVKEFFAGNESLNDSTFLTGGIRQRFGMAKIQARNGKGDVDIGAIKTACIDGEYLYGHNLEYDSSQRDYTVNAIYFDVIKSGIYDPCGGLKHVLEAAKDNKPCPVFPCPRSMNSLREDLGGRIRLFKLLGKKEFTASAEVLDVVLRLLVEDVQWLLINFERCVPDLDLACNSPKIESSSESKRASAVRNLVEHFFLKLGKKLKLKSVQDISLPAAFKSSLDAERVSNVTWFEHLKQRLRELSELAKDYCFADNQHARNYLCAPLLALYLPTDARSSAGSPPRVNFREVREKSHPAGAGPYKERTTIEFLNSGQPDQPIADGEFPLWSPKVISVGSTLLGKRKKPYGDHGGERKRQATEGEQAASGDMEP